MKILGSGGNIETFVFDRMRRSGIQEPTVAGVKSWRNQFTIRTGYSGTKLIGTKGLHYG